MRRPATLLALAAAAGLAVSLSSCAAPAATAPSTDGKTSEGKISVVASTNVYGDIVSAIGGDKVAVSAIISKTSQDPHSYEATAQDKLAVSKAKLVVENGGGYDGFLHKLADETNIGHDNIVTAVEVSGLVPAEAADAHASESPSASGDHSQSHDGVNEHVWYSLDAMSKVADAVATKLGTLDPGAAADFKANSTKFKASLAELNAKLQAIKAGNNGAPVAITEPVPLYLLEAAGLSNKTPADYSEAIEEGTDVPPAALKETTDLVSTKAVRLLAYNQQTSGPQTEAVRTAAVAAGVPVVDFTETLPDGKDYVQWMTANVDAVAAAVNKTAAHS